MDGDVAFRQHRHAGYAVRLKMMKMDVQECGARGFDAAAQSRLDVLEVIEPLRAMQVDDQMHASAAHAFAKREMALTVLLRRRSGHFQFGLVFFSGGTWDPQALPRS